MKESWGASSPLPDEIAIFRPEFIEFGEGERVIFALSRRLHELKKPHFIVCYLDAIDLASFANLPIKVHQLLLKRYVFAKAMPLRRCLKTFNAADSPTPVLFIIQSACHAGILVKIPYHLWRQDTYSLLCEGFSNARPFQSPGRWLGVLLLHFFTGQYMLRAQTLLAISTAFRGKIADLYGRIADVINLGGFSGPLPHVTSRASAPIRILSVPRLQQSMRIDRILHARAGKQDLPVWELNIVGKGPDLSRLVDLAAALKLGSRVIFHRFVDDAALRELYRSSHIFAMPAVQGYGLPAIEALYQYLAMVMSSDSGIAEVLGAARTVVISKRGSNEFARALCETIRRVSNPAFLGRLLPPMRTEDQWDATYTCSFGW